MKKIILVLLVLLFPLSLEAAQIDSKEDMRSLIKNVMTYISNGETLKGLELLKPYVIITDAEFDSMIEQYQLQESMINYRFGKTVGTEFFSEEKAGQSVLRLIYIQKFEKHIIRWNFYFYRPEDKWVLNTFFFDDKIQLLFEN